MEHITDTNIRQSMNTAVTLGKFDGLHNGHKELICTMQEYARVHRLKTVVFSFYPHPVEVLTGERQDAIYSQAEKVSILKKMNIDLFIEYPFNRSFANIRPDEFVNEILQEQMKCKVLIIGEGYRFGKDKAGDYEILSRRGRSLGMEVIRITHVGGKSGKVSSSSIRRMIQTGDFAGAEIMLGRPYFIRGIVETGHKEGRKMGFPTVNLHIPKGKLTPANGVYLTKMLYNGAEYYSISNVGHNPTFGGCVKKCETHIFDFNADIYGQEISVCFYKPLRREMKFVSTEALRKQISQDVAVATAYWKNKKGGCV